MVIDEKEQSAGLVNELKHLPNKSKYFSNLYKNVINLFLKQISVGPFKKKISVVKVK